MRPDLERMLRESRAVVPDPPERGLARTTAAVLARAERAARRRRGGLAAGAAASLLLAVSVAAIAAERAPHAPRAEPLTQVVDRTLLCETSLTRGVPGVRVFAMPRDPAFRVGARVLVESGQGRDATSVAVAEPSPSRDGVDARGFAHYTHASCRPVPRRVAAGARPRVPLAAAGLASRPLEWEQWHSCELRGPVLVRVRVVYARPTRWVRWTSPNPQAVPSAMRAVGPLREAYVAVRTQRGDAPVAFATVGRAGERLFLARRCWAS